MSEQLELLLTLQDIDADLAELLSQRELLPKRIAELTKQKEDARADIARRESALEEATKERQRLERDLEDMTTRIHGLKSKQLMIKTNEEYAALNTEIGFASHEISDIEGGIFKLMESIEEAGAEIAAAAEAAAEAEKGIDVRVAELERELSHKDDDVAVKTDERLRIAMRVDAPLLRRYEGLLESKGDSALAYITDGACSGCYKSLPPQTILEVKRATGFNECDGCGRILYWRREADVE